MKYPYQNPAKVTWFKKETKHWAVWHSLRVAAPAGSLFQARGLQWQQAYTECAPSGRTIISTLLWSTCSERPRVSNWARQQDGTPKAMKSRSQRVAGSLGRCPEQTLGHSVCSHLSLLTELCGAWLTNLQGGGQGLTGTLQTSEHRASPRSHGTETRGAGRTGMARAAPPNANHFQKFI